MDKPWKTATAEEKRQFRHFVKLASDGRVAATIEVAVGAPDPVDGEGNLYVEVTELYPYDFTAVRVKKAHVTNGDHAAVKESLTAANRVRRVG